MYKFLCPFKFNQSAFHELFTMYNKRLGYKIELISLKTKKTDDISQKKHYEYQQFKQYINYPSFIVLDEKGEQYSSYQFAMYLQQCHQQAHVPIVFAIGGADGIDEALSSKAHKKISYGRCTWPHKMVVAMLAEQIYRAHSIIEGTPYHRE